MANKQQGVDATFYDMEQCLAYRRVYASRKGFLSALSRMNTSRYVFRSAVDYQSVMVIKPDNLSDYRRMK